MNEKLNKFNEDIIENFGEDIFKKFNEKFVVEEVTDGEFLVYDRGATMSIRFDKWWAGAKFFFLFYKEQSIGVICI